MVLDRFAAERGSDGTALEKESTAERFAYEWKKFSGIYPEYERQFFDFVKPVDSGFLSEKTVLDAGCGMGRFLGISSKYCREIIGMDLGESIDVAFANTRGNKNVYAVQADIYKPPFRKKFDFVYCVGVLHHLPDPKTGFSSLVKLVRPGGHIAIWVYGRENNLLLKLMDPVRRHVFTRMPAWALDLLAFAIMLFLFPVIKLVYRPANETAGLRNFARFLPQNSFFYYLSGFNFEVNHSILFDQFVAPIAFYVSREEVESWLDSQPLKEKLVSRRNNNSWRAFARKTG